MMNTLFKNNYRIKSARLQNWDYSAEAAYFMTICTSNRTHFFGEITNKEMILSALGNEVANAWMQSIEIRPDMNLSLGEFVVMPNHFHGIIFIGANDFNIRGTDAMHGVSTVTGNKFGPQSKNLSSIVRGFKSSVTTWARKNNIPFHWQDRFHDHMIRNATAYNRISNYIINNPSQWQEDTFYSHL